VPEVRYHVLVCDYDGTIAHHGAVDPATIEALDAVKKSGRRLVLVTGRQLDDLARVFEPLELFDRIVAENGGLLYDPASRQDKPLCKAPDEALLRILGERGVAPLSAGKTIVASWTPHEHVILDAIQELGLELQVIFNKGAVMVLPTGVNKASGLAAALEDLKLSPHNAVAVGDAENDHALLHLCEFAVAVANALPALRDAADLVTRGDHGSGVRELCGLLIDEDLGSLMPTRHYIPLGNDCSGDEVVLPAYSGAILVAGSSGSGKSTLTTAVMEHLIDEGYQLCIVDPEGDYEHFEPAVVLGTSDNSPTIGEILDVLKEPGRNVVANLLALRADERPAFSDQLLPQLMKLRAATGRPHWIVVDEAHHLFPREWKPTGDLMPEGLNGCLMITVHPDHIASTVLETVETLIAIGSEPLKTMERFSKSRNLAVPVTDAGSDLDYGEAVLWQLAKDASPLLFRSRPPKRQMRRHLRKYAEGKLGKDKSFYFRGAENQVHLRAYNLTSFMEIGEGLDEDTWLHHLLRGDYSDWVRGSIKDLELADEIATIEASPRTTANESRARIRTAIERRYTLPA
jgi:hydroxymethylpyrimidine pyrophosphatase-like HAD family hydrolase